MTERTPIAVPAPDTMTLAELAARLDIGMTKAREMAKAGTLPVPTLRVGRQYRFSRRAFLRWLEGDSAERSYDAA